jgi:hypothetical protein
MIRTFCSVQNDPLHRVRVKAHERHPPMGAKASANNSDLVIAQRLSDFIEIRRSLEHPESLEIQPLGLPVFPASGGCLLDQLAILFVGWPAIERKIPWPLACGVGCGRADSALSDHDEVCGLSHLGDLALVEPRPLEISPETRVARPPVQIENGGRSGGTRTTRGELVWRAPNRTVGVS